MGLGMIFSDCRVHTATRLAFYVADGASVVLDGRKAFKHGPLLKHVN